MDYQYIVQFIQRDKNLFLEDADIDKGIRPLVNAINSIKCFLTMNSCQGCLIADEAENHCSLTYVDFYVLYHKYELAHNLFSILKNKFDDGVLCSVEYESDFDLTNEDEVDFNGDINLRFTLQISDEQIDLENIYKDVVKTIEDFSLDLKA
jgi:tRNA(Phe) wybutosine-synthesizing methylase Tyw3